MDCQTASEWMAGWVDEQLSPGERELMAAHLQRCPSCRQRAHAMARQVIAPPTTHVLRPDFWDRMDAALSEAQDALHPEPEPEPAQTPAPTSVSLLQQRFQNQGPLLQGALQPTGQSGQPFQPISDGHQITGAGMTGSSPPCQPFQIPHRPEQSPQPLSQWPRLFQH